MVSTLYSVLQNTNQDMNYLRDTIEEYNSVDEFMSGLTVDEQREFMRIYNKCVYIAELIGNKPVS